MRDYVTFIYFIIFLFNFLFYLFIFILFLFFFVPHLLRISRCRQSKEPMFVRKPRTIEAVEDEQVIIECEVAGDPNLHITWLRDWLKVGPGLLFCCYAS